jgi:hypothetical protein
MILQLKSNPKLRDMLRKAFPSYRKHAIILSKGEKVSLSGASWSGGSRSYYHAVNLSTGEIVSVDGQAWNERECPQATIVPGTAIAETGIFCGKKATLILTIHPEDSSAWIESESR